MASSSVPLEPTLALKPSYVPKSLPSLLKDLSNNDDSESKLSVLNDYLLKHKEELVLVGVFKQELPQCKLMLMDAIETLKKEIRKIKKDKKPASESAPRDVLASKKNIGGLEQAQRVHLISPSAEQWNFTTNHDDKRQKTTLGTIQETQTQIVEVLEEFISFEPPPRMVEQIHDRLNLRPNERLLNCKLQPLTQSICKNKRMSWTLELHGRFVVGLDLLGGPEVATPKQVRDYMQVEWLTTNQVKSHLQKYRRTFKRLISPADRGTNFPSPGMIKTYYRGFRRPNAGGASTADGTSMEDID